MLFLRVLVLSNEVWIRNVYFEADRVSDRIVRLPELLMRTVVTLKSAHSSLSFKVLIVSMLLLLSPGPFNLLSFSRINLVP